VSLTLKVEINKNNYRSFETWCWKSKEKIGWIDRVKNGVLQTVEGGKEYPTYHEGKEG